MSQFSLTEQEKTAVYAFVKNMRPDDEQFLLQMAHFRGHAFLSRRCLAASGMSPI